MVVLMRQELEVLEMTDNQYVTRVLQLLESEDKLFIVMELAKEGSLDNFFYEHIDELDERVILHILHQLFLALKYLHETKQIIHRDLKPENILVSHYDFSKGKVHIMLTDFGFALNLARDPGNESLINCGTAHFKAPEIIRGEDYDNKVDIWSAGCIAYFLYSGFHYPFGDGEDLT